jgi:ubiquinone/menaquinone biosynthesis C-methylase UbiE
MKKITTDKELQQSYNTIWSNTILKESISYYSWIADLLRIQKGKKFLDVACGAGFMLKIASDRGAETFGVDISDVAVSLSKNASENSKVVVCNGENLLFDNATFDYVTCLGSLEHYLHPQKGVSEISRVVKNNGLVVIVLPNKWHWFECYNGMRRGTDPSHGQELERYYSRKEAEKLIEDNGLHIIKVFGYNKQFFNGILSYFYNPLIRKIIPVNASYHFVIMCKMR